MGEGVSLLPRKGVPGANHFSSVSLVCSDPFTRDYVSVYVSFLPIKRNEDDMPLLPFGYWTFNMGFFETGVGKRVSPSLSKNGCDEDGSSPSGSRVASNLEDMAGAATADYGVADIEVVDLQISNLRDHPKGSAEVVPRKVSNCRNASSHGAGHDLYVSGQQVPEFIRFGEPAQPRFGDMARSWVPYLRKSDLLESYPRGPVRVVGDLP